MLAAAPHTKCGGLERKAALDSSKGSNSTIETRLCPTPGILCTHGILYSNSEVSGCALPSLQVTFDSILRVDPQTTSSGTTHTV